MATVLLAFPGIPSEIAPEVALLFEKLRKRVAGTLLNLKALRERKTRLIFGEQDFKKICKIDRPIDPTPSKQRALVLCQPRTAENLIPNLPF